MFQNLKVGTKYSRKQLAQEWGYKSYQAIARGVVTPRGLNKIILFVTEDKQKGSKQYEDRIDDEVLYWEGPTDHYAEDRMVLSLNNDDEIHLFYRDRHHSDFIYYGQVDVANADRFNDRPSRFTLRLKEWNDK